MASKATPGQWIASKVRFVQTRTGWYSWFTAAFWRACRAHAETVVFLLVLTAGAALRYRYCTLYPVNTRDIIRHIVYGRLVAERGLAIAGHALTQIHPDLAVVTWSRLPYNYPIVTLAFFTMVSALWHTVFFAKLALTLVEAVNAWLVYAYSGQRWLAAVYWMLPQSIWWVSREGQFEPLQSLFTLAALCLLPRVPMVAFALLALAIQVKVSAVLLCLLLFSAVWSSRRKFGAALAGLALGAIPSAVGLLYYPAITQVFRYSAPDVYNPYYWNVTARALFRWNPSWLIVADQVSSYGLLVLLSWLAVRSRKGVQYFAPLAFLVLCKLRTNAQPWYMLLLPAFLLPIENRRWRFWLIALTPLLDVYSCAEMLFGPFGYTVGDYYRWLAAFNLTSFIH